ncbi:hypothetical protein Rru_A0187 [Rhodospirillum rubrum ATCC 11170]|uniref:Mutator family transposase n=1 Tax=Rhodospirillum rubrum (strain ATCC 11170 / ATH 1.1.1 / DSM 467 / LMG 4362 / NCIMB 8255 / S1) TaxID=269796 RepID=Q2RY03_RHORT|nr:hypothetical protein Rru_A0187 [Rhodospirillum rubrum ATCC 11170]
MDPAASRPPWTRRGSARGKALAQNRRTKSLDALLPALYLRGISTGDFQEALSALLGKEAPCLSPAVISRLTGESGQTNTSILAIDVPRDRQSSFDP